MRFVRVKLAPKYLQKGEYVIDAPNFMEEVRSCDMKKPKNHTMSVNYMREIVHCIGAKYIGDTFNAYTDVNVSNYRGTPCENTEQAHEIIVKLFKEHYPQIFDAYVEYHVKRRPNGTNLIYYYGPGSQTAAFVRLGFEEVLEKDLNKSKKIVGKPAITDEEAANNQETVV